MNSRTGGLAPCRFNNRGMSLAGLFRYAWSDLRHRRAATILNVVAVALAAGYTLILGTCGAGIYSYQQGLLAENLPTRVVATAAEVTDRASLFTAERIREMERLPGVKRAFPHLELNVLLSRGPGPAISVPAESTVPGDATLAPHRLTWGAGVSSEEAREIVLSRALFEKLGGVLRSGAEPASLTLQVARTVAGREEVQRIEVTVAGLLRHQGADRVYLPARLLAQLDLYCTHKLSSLTGRGRPASARTYPFCRAYGPAEQRDRVKEEVAGLRVEASPAGEVELVEADGPIAVLVRRQDGKPLQAADRARVLEELGAWCAAVPGDIVGPGIAREAGPDDLVLHFQTPLGFQSAARLAPAHGWLLRPLSALRRVRWFRYEVRDPRGPNGRVREEVVAALALARPTFVTAHPSLIVSGTVSREGQIGDPPASGQQVQWCGSGPSDPERFAAPLLAGSWLGEDASVHPVVLPQAVAVEAAGGRSLSSLVGSAITLHLARQLAGKSVETIALPLRVVGIVASAQGYLPLALAGEIGLWREGKLMFNDTRLTFETPLDIALRSGAVRCNIDAVDVEATTAVVQALRKRGYRTEDRLAEQEGLRRLGRVLVFVVGFFVLGCVLNAAISVCISTAMNIRAKVYEIGILRAHGVGNGRILAIFGAQGTLIGTAAFLVAVGFVFLLGPALQGLIGEAFGLKDGLCLTATPFDPALWWLPALVLGVSVGFSLLGVLIPAALACRLSPVAALRSRE